MELHYFLLLKTIAIVTLLGCSNAGKATKRSPNDQQNMKKLAGASNYFALNMYQQLAKGSQDNIFFSPLSLSTALGMLYEGAGGESQKELQNVLGYQKSELSDKDIPSTFQQLLDTLSSNEGKGYDLNNANAMYIDKNLEIKHEFNQTARKYFKAKVENVDFAKDGKKVTAEINDFVSDTTNGNIKDFIDDVGSDTIMFLLNAVYFLGNWDDPFNPNDTQEETFYNHGLSSEQTNVQMMHQTEEFRYTTFEDAQVLELPYRRDSASMIIILPNKMDGLSDVESKLDDVQFNQILENLDKNRVVVSFPKFKVEYSKELSQEMSALGAVDIFSDLADFSGITSGQGVKVSQIQHKAVVEVNEKGSEAAAATGIKIVPLSYIEYPVVPDFKVDHPFIFAILDKMNNMVLFFGRVNTL